MDKKLIKLVEERLKALDYAEQLKVEKVPMPIPFWIKPAEEGKSHSRNPTLYIVNTARDYRGICPLDVFATIIVSRAVRCRRQSGENKLKTFCSFKVSEEFSGMIKPLIFNTWGQYQADSEVVARIAGSMHENNFPIKEIAEMLLMDAPAIVEKYGRDFIEDSMYIVI